MKLKNRDFINLMDFGAADEARFYLEAAFDWLSENTWNILPYPVSRIPICNPLPVKER